MTSAEGIKQTTLYKDSGGGVRHQCPAAVHRLRGTVFTAGVEGETGPLPLTVLLPDRIVGEVATRGPVLVDGQGLSVRARFQPQIVGWVRRL